MSVQPVNLSWYPNTKEARCEHVQPSNANVVWANIFEHRDGNHQK